MTCTLVLTEMLRSRSQKRLELRHFKISIYTTVLDPFITSHTPLLIEGHESSIKSLTVSEGGQTNNMVVEGRNATITCVVENLRTGTKVEGMIEDSIGE